MVGRAHRATKSATASHSHDSSPEEIELRADLPGEFATHFEPTLDIPMPPPTVVSCVEPLPCACPWQVLPICLDALAMRSSRRSMSAPTHTRRVLGTSTNLSRRRRVWAKVAASQSSRWTWVVACVARGSIYSQAGCRLKIVSRAVLPTRLRHDVPTIICIPTERMCRLGPSTAPTIALSQIIGESRRLANASGWKGGVCAVCCGLVPHFKRLCVLCGSDSNSQFAVKPRP